MRDQRCVLTLTGHELTVWSVLQMATGAITTGSADRSIRVYSPDGAYLRTLTGKLLLSNLIFIQILIKAYCIITVGLF